jgi:hypothetical protein
MGANQSDFQNVQGTVPKSQDCHATNLQHDLVQVAHCYPSFTPLYGPEVDIECLLIEVEPHKNRMVFLNLLLDLCEFPPELLDSC